MSPSIARGVARINPLSDVSCGRDSLDVRHDICFRIAHVKVEDLVLSSVGCKSDSLDVDNDTGSRIDHVMVKDSIDRESDIASCTLHGAVISKRRQCGHMDAARRLNYLCGDGNVQLHTLANGVTGGVGGKISFAVLPSLNALLELDEMSMDGFHQALKADELSEVVVHRPELALCSSSPIDEAIIVETKAASNARSGSSIVKNPSDFPIL